MIAYTLYLLLILWLICRNGFFGIFTDATVSKKQFAILFFFKALAVPVFYFVYKKIYGGIELFDAGKFYNDATVIGEYALKDVTAYLRLLIGLQNDTEGSADFVNFLQRTNNWDNGKLKDFLYNDNRVVIRVHSLLYFIAFGSYFVHALFNCLFGFIGITFFYKALSHYFSGQNLVFLILFCFFPALWFYSGAVLKEGLCLFVIGCQTYALKQLITQSNSWKYVLMACVLFFISLFLKPYLTLLCTFSFTLFFYIESKPYLKFKSLVFIGTATSVFVIANMASFVIKKQSLFSAIEHHQKVFSDMSKGGIFLVDSEKFVRLNDNDRLVNKINGNDSVYTIAKNASYQFWEHSHQQDTLYCEANKDTLSQYKLAYRIGESKSNIKINEQGIFKTIVSALYYSLLHPFFFNAKGLLQVVASLENLLLLISLLIFSSGLIRNKKSNFLPLVLVFLTLSICVLSGLATPNSGAIFRYRSPVAVYVLMVALYYVAGKHTLVSNKNPTDKIVN